MKCPLLSPEMFFALNCTLVLASYATFFWLVFTWNIFSIFCIHLLCLRYVSWKHHWTTFYFFFIHSDSLLIESNEYLYLHFLCCLLSFILLFHASLCLFSYILLVSMFLLLYLLPSTEMIAGLCFTILSKSNMNEHFYHFLDNANLRVLCMCFNSIYFWILQDVILVYSPYN